MKPCGIGLASLFIVVLGLGCKTAQPKPDRTTIEGIERVLAADAAANQATLGVRRTIFSSPTPAQLIEQYTVALRNISFDGVPNEFHYAYMEHIHAWEAMKVHLQRKPENGDFSMLIGLLAIAGGQPHLAGPALLNGANQTARNSRQAEADKNAASDRIQLTWNKIELLAVRHGAKLPRPSVAPASRYE